jgi:hypothetical protein
MGAIMAGRRILLSELRPGEALPWDLYGATEPCAPLLLRKGELAPAADQIEALAEAGLYTCADDAPSVLHQLNDANWRLERLLHDLHTNTDAERDLRDIAACVVRAVEQQPDIALACVFLNQIGGSHAVRHSTETAVVARLIARGLQAGPQTTLRVVAAALTMNASMLHQHDSFQSRRTALTREEIELMRRHPADSAELLKCAGIKDEEWLACVMLHHQHDSGDGDADDGGVVNRDARLIGLADRYCARVSARNYRSSLLPDHALHHALREARLPVEIELAAQLALQVGAYPPGTLVRLENGERGVVTRRAQGGAGALVRALIGIDGKPLPGDTAPFAALRDTDADGLSIAEALHEDQLAVRFSMRHVWGELAAL